MNEEIKDDTRLKVTSVGNSWIVCKSKSHAGHVYYFNTLTGEAAWNLSDSEIEKAKRRTKHLEHLPGGHPTRCPEPIDKPPTLDPEQAHKESPETFLINTVSEKQASVVTFSNVANNKTTFFSSLNQMPALINSTQITNHPVQDPPGCVSNLNINSLSNSVRTFNLNTPPIIYNPKVWAVPHAQQVYMTPTMAPVVNHNPAPMVISDNNLSQTMPKFPVPPFRTSLNGFENGNICTMTTGIRTFHPRYKVQGGVRSGKISAFARKNDLRQKLSAKKRFNVLPSIGNSGGSKNPRTEISSHIASNNGIQTSDRTLENRCTDTQLHEDTSKIDLTPLKCLAPSDSNSDGWFIVVDLDILLNDFKFLTSLTDSDDQCHLMVPKRVMEELKSYVTCTENIQSRRILRFLSQQIEIGYAFMAEEPSEVKGDSIAEAIYATCTELSEHKYHLILLCNDPELLTYENPSNIKVFSIDEVKKLLMGNPNKQQVSSTPKKPFMVDGIIKKIKITVPNDTLQSIDTNSYKNDIPVTVANPEQNCTQDKTTESTSLKHTADAGIQTDFEDINASICTSNVADKHELNPILPNPQNSKEIIISCPVASVSKLPDKKREIKLKRSSSNQPVPSGDSVKKQFKWRRRRNTTPQVLNAAPSYYEQNTSPRKAESPQTNAQPGKISNNYAITGPNENKIPDNGIESRESSITADTRNSTRNDNVTIEETSTSGIISNTESNVDEESNYSYSIVNQEQTVNNKTFNMYEVENITMEEYLKIKSDEWVSRFVQIMEEALSQVLQQNPPFSHSKMPPPWTLHEASQCIAIKYCNHSDVIEAANKLSSILFHVSDAKGKIAVNMTPFQYMQMYSYGVHLLATIMKVNNNCEDIQIAVEALNKLLDDIKNPNMDSSTNDTFNDNIQDNVLNDEVSKNPDNQITDSHGSNGLHEQETSSDFNVTRETPNLRHNKRKLNEEEQPKPVKFIRKIDIESDKMSLFFKTLELKKLHYGNSSIFKLKNNDSYNSEVQLHEKLIDSRIEEQINSRKDCENGTDIFVPSNQPRIIRNFNIYPDLEEKLKRNCKKKVYEDHDDDLDYDEDYEEYIPEESESIMVYDQRNGGEDNTNNDTKDHKSPQMLDPFTDDNSKMFKFTMYSFLQDIRNTLCQVRMLCDQCYEELKNPDGSSEQKRQLQKMAKRAHIHITCLCKSLESVLEHGTNNLTQSMRKILKQADINICHVDDGLLFEYRMTVAKCKDFADLLSCSIQNIISAFKS